MALSQEAIVFYDNSDLIRIIIINVETNLFYNELKLSTWEISKHYVSFYFQL